MKARIIKQGELWYGQVYGTWSHFLVDHNWEGWENVTIGCFTRLGAKYELKKWTIINCPPEFEV